MNCQVNQHKAYLYFQQDMTPINSNMTKNKAIEEKRGRIRDQKKTHRMFQYFPETDSMQSRKKGNQCSPPSLCLVKKARQIYRVSVGISLHDRKFGSGD